jgi:N-acetylmuramoyl-L-alanine amidase
VVTEAGGDQDRGATVTRRALIASGFLAGAAFALAPSWSSGRAGTSSQAAATPGPPAGDAARTLAAPAIVRRAEWGADEGLRSGAIDFDPVVEKIVIHHTGIDDGSGNWAGQVRDIYQWETASGYRDIAYHVLVDPNGLVYEGRWARDYAEDEQPDAEDARGWGVRGGHARAHNPRTFGIALLGDYTRSQPAAAAVASIFDLLVWKCGRWGVDPLGASPYTNTRGEVMAFPNIVPHGQIRATQCPGPHLDALLPDLRTRTADELARLAAATGSE